MKPRLWISIPLVALCLIGAVISKLLLDKHLFKAAGPSWFASVCGEPPAAGPATTEPGEAPQAGPPPAAGALPGANCGAVLASRWATIPPRPEAEEDLLEGGAAPQRGVSIPVAYVGMVYFLSLTIWFLFIGRPTPDRPQWFRLPLAFVLGGVLFSAAYLILMFTGMGEWCPWCLATHAINFVVLIGMLFLRPGKSSVQPAGVSHQASTAAASTAATHHPPLTTHEPIVTPHPSGRLVATSILLCAAAGAMLWNGYAAMVVKAETAGLRARLNKFEQDTNFLATLYAAKPEVKITIREDDPQTSRDENFSTLVVFSDFQCPWCRSFSTVIEKRLRPKFNQHLRVVWKHYPLSTECNPHAQRNTHAEACRAARAAEAARLQGGDDAFWRAHDRIFAAQQQLKDFDYAAMAGEIGLDAEKLLNDMESDAVTQRIAEDIAQARSLGVNSTPAIFLNNRAVEPMLAKLGPFWDLMAHNFNYQYEEKTYPEKMKRLEQEGKLPPLPRAATQASTQDDHAGHGHD